MSRLKRMVSILLITLILIGSFPAGVFAMEECTHENVDPHTGKCTNPDCEDPDFGYTASLTVDGNTSYYHLLFSEGDHTGVIDAARETGGTIRLFKDVKTRSLEFHEREFVLDLNGHSMEHNDEGGNSKFISVLNGANLTITDSSDGKAGKILHGLDFGDEENAVCVYQNSKCTVEKVTIECTNGKAAYVHGELTVEGATFAGGAAVIDVDIWMIDGEVGRGKVTIKDGSFSGNFEVIGTLQIEGGTFSNDGDQVDVDGDRGDEVSKVVLNGGNFPDGLRLKGVFNAGNVLAENKYFWNDGKQLSPAQTEQNFEGNITIADPCEHPTSKISDETGICADCQTQFAASVTIGEETTYYKDFRRTFYFEDEGAADAINSKSGTIKLFKDVELGDNVISFSNDSEEINNNVTLDLNGHKITGSNNGRTVMTGKTNLTVTDTSENKNGMIVNTSDKAVVVTVEGGSEFVLESGTLYAEKYNLEYGALEVYGSAVIKGGTVKVERGVAVYTEGNGSVLIEDGTINGNIKNIGEKVSITGGTFKYNENAEVEFQISSELGVNPGALEIRGGHFPGGIHLFSGYNAGNSLADGYAFWTVKTETEPAKMLQPKDDETNFSADIEVKTVCTHPAEKISHDTGICADCQTQFAASVTVDAATTYYADLDSAAAEALEAEESKITLYTDVDYSEKTEGFMHFCIAASGKVLTIDLNGHEIKGKNYGILIEGGDVIIEDSSADASGKVTSTTEVSGGYGINIRYGSLTVNGGTITGFDGISGGSDADVTINEGKITGSGYHAVISHGETVINGGIFTGVGTTIRAESGHLTINGGEFYGSPGADNVGISVGFSDTVVNINGGTFKIDNCTISAPFSLTALVPLSHKITIGLDEDGNGPSFPQGIRARYTTLGSFLTYGSSFWQGEKMIDLDGTETLLEGNLTVRATCLHPDERINHETGICGGCNLQIYVAKVSFNGGEEQLVSDLNSEVFISDQTGKAEVTLIADIVLDENGLWVDPRYGGISDIVLNLNGHKIAGGSVSVFAVMPEGSLVINGSGTVIVPDVEDAEPVAVEVTEGATAELNGITIEYADGGKALLVENGGILKAKNVVVNSASEALCSYGNAEFTDCTLEGTDEAVYIGSGTVTLKDTDVTVISGDESGNKIAVMMDGGMLNISGGTIRGDSAFYVFSGEQAGTTVNLSGCTVYGAVEENGSAKINVGENVKFPEGYQGYRSFIDRMLKGGYALYDAQTSLPADMGTNPEDIKGDLITKTLDLSHAEVRFASEGEIYDGNEHKPALSVLFGGLTLGEELYSVSYEGGFVNIGSYKVVVTPAENSSAVGSTSAYFTILPDSGLIESITKENVTSSDEDAVREVLESIKEADLTNVSDEMKEELQKISEKCEELINVVEEVQKKGQEIGEVLNGLKPENVTPEDEEAVKDVISKLDELISGTNITPEEKAELEEAKKDAEEIIKEIGVQKEVIKAKEEAEKDLQDGVKPEEYRDSEKAQIGKILSDAKEALKKATTTEEVEKIVSETKAKLDALKTDSELKAEELVKTKEEAAEAVADMVDPEEYRPAQKAEIDAIRKEASEAISAAKSQEEVEKIVSETKSRLEAVKTDKELTAEELIPGDADGNGSVDAKDATQILRYINGKACIFTQEGADTEKLLKAADVDGSGDVDAKDATQILRYINGKTSLFDRM